VTVDTYSENFYGTDYFADPLQAEENRPGLQSDRLVARWNLGSARVASLGSGAAAEIEARPVASVAIPAEWSALVKRDPHRAREVQARVRDEFKKYFSQGLVCAAFERGDEESRYLLFEPPDRSE